jgi:hypothetical protein
MSYVIFKNRKFNIHNKNKKNEETPQIELLDIKIDHKVESTSDNKNNIQTNNIQTKKPKVSKAYQEFLDTLKISDE